MKNLDKKMLNNVYPEVPESFHNAVISTLDSLEAEKPVKFKKRRTTMRIVAACAAVAVIGTFAAAAAATDFFGLYATKRGKYGLDVTVENSKQSDSDHQSMKLKFGYLPEEYKTEEYESGKSTNYLSMYENEDNYFNAWIDYTDNYHDDLTNVVKTEETEYNGHKTLIITFKEAKNTDKMYYSTLKYFEEYNCLVRCNGTNYDELIKITEKVETEPDTQPVIPKDVLDEDDVPYDRAITDYLKDGDGFRDEYFSGNVKKAKIGESVDMAVANYGQEAVHMTAKVISVKEQDNTDGLDLKDFLTLGGNDSLYYRYFNTDGTFIKRDEFTVHEDADDYDLGTVRNIVINKHFYVADIELTAQEDIDDLSTAFETEVYCIDVDNKFFYGYYTPDYEYVLKIYGTNINNKQSIKKGETLNVKMGFIADNDTVDNAYIIFSAVDAPNDYYQNYMIKFKE